ncbi:hypothetical protein SpCBS45565_g00165 [Spizellomyces sp. 'palustris']|nr:hypothetical protein SpCBS45565_g00165 [Spizellomyces sp. 'palustris']
MRLVVPLSLVCLLAHHAHSASLIQCLSGIQDGSKVIVPSDPVYPKASLGQDYRFTYKPAAIFIPTKEKHIQTAVICANANNVTIAPRSGGHSYEGYSQGGKNGALLVDLYKLDSVSVDKNARTAVVGTGNLLAPLYYKLWTAGKYAFPGGTCPTVGVGGLTLHGGYGLLGRKYGVAADQVLEITMVSAKGDTLVANKNQSSDLFWALRGAGSFGIITSFKIALQTVPNPDVVTSFTYDWPASQHSAVLAAYNTWGPKATNDVTTELNWDSAGSLELQGLYLGPKSNLNGILKGFMDAVGSKPSASDVRQQSLIDALLRFTWMDTTNPADMLHPVAQDAKYMKGNSLLYSAPFSGQTIQIMNKYLSSVPSGSTGAYIIVDLWGGQVNNVPISETAFIHRNELFGIEIVVEWGNMNAPPGKPDCPACLTWINNFYGDLATQYRKEYKINTVPAYQNYIDKGLPNWQQAYYGAAYDRLKQVKRQYDPSNRFQFPQSIPLN